MKKLFIIKIGTTFPGTEEQHGDFDAWTTAALGDVNLEISTRDVEHGDALPEAGECAGVVITGSHAMVTDDLPWSVSIEKWIPSLLITQVPVFGICYGHQLLARAAGGRVDYRKGGKEIGTVEVQLLSACADDPLFRSLPQSFFVHTTHSQSVLHLPPKATRLAANADETNHAFRVGDSAWGVQFHPEYTAGIMRSYIREQAAELELEGKDLPALMRGVENTPAATQILGNFAIYVEECTESACNHEPGAK